MIKMLTIEEKQFCEEYIKDFDIIGAYHRSNLHLENYSVEKIYKLVNQKHIQDYIKKLIFVKQSNQFMSKTQVLSELSKLASFDFFDLYEYDEYKEKHVLKQEIPAHCRKWIKYISKDNVYTFDKIEALKLLLNYHIEADKQKNKKSPDLNKLKGIIVDIPDVEGD